MQRSGIVKYGLLILAIIILNLSVTDQSIGQNLAGKIYYDHNITVEFDQERYAQMTEERRNRIKQRMEEMGKMKKVLVFNETSSVYRNFSAEKDALTEDGWNTEGGRARWRMMRPETIIYQSFEDNITVEQKDIFDKLFLITDERVKPLWKITGEQEEILKFPCNKAIFQKNDSTKIEAWFNMSIPVPAGPAAYNELPGMIMKLVVNGGEEMIIATAFKFYSPDDSELAKPTKGKKVTEAEYQKIRKEKRQEMKDMYGGAGNRH
ncbi:MAG: GLPGLI family protein [Bacteroidia bacterium]|nr:GLPGLI family protein [Bacteroidia bacterium]